MKPLATNEELISVEDACKWLSNNLHLVRDWLGTPAENYREFVRMFRKEMQQYKKKLTN